MGKKPQGRQGFCLKLSFSKLKFSVSGKEVLDKVGWAFSPTLKYCWGRNPNLQKAVASHLATTRGRLVPVAPRYHG